MKTKTLDWWKCSISKQEAQKETANSKIMDAVISSDAIQCLRKDGFNVEKIVPYSSHDNTKSIITT